MAAVLGWRFLKAYLGSKIVTLLLEIASLSIRGGWCIISVILKLIGASPCSSRHESGNYKNSQEGASKSPDDNSRNETLLIDGIYVFPAGPDADECKLCFEPLYDGPPIYNTDVATADVELVEKIYELKWCGACHRAIHRKCWRDVRNKSSSNVCLNCGRPWTDARTFAKSLSAGSSMSVPASSSRNFAI
ncbi:hypothetical protein PM082_022146 [Marasmius tenuissimus]|nr:hypothetical protein PM082_022146 [Marasmius tenuissimus]